MTDIEDTISDNYRTNHLLIRHHETMEKVDHIEYLNPKTKPLVKDLVTLINNKSISLAQYKVFQRQVNQKHSYAPTIISMNFFYRLLVENKEIEPCPDFEKYNVGKMNRTNSGITQITVLSSPYPNGQAFSCEHNCYYCPNEPAHEGNRMTPQPRSYLFNEPAVRRANANRFDGAEQMWDRMSTLMLCGHDIDKLEVMVLGGTWGSYPTSYRIEFIRDLYYAANTFYCDSTSRRMRYSMNVEIIINMTAKVRVIGLTLETRPDHINKDEILLMRDMNCTRVQIGVQHTDDNILKKINRGCYLEDVKLAIMNLLNVGLKVDIHIMFDLPFASADDDKKMIDMLTTDTDLRFDQAKLYPFVSLDYTVAKQWEDKGINLHYTQDELINVLIYAKTKMPVWVRLNRVIRDIPNEYILGGNSVTNLRQVLEDKMKKCGLKCRCIRCREVKNKANNIETAKLKVRSYIASGGTEYHITIENDNDILYGFLRLRLSKNSGYINNTNVNTNENTNDNSTNLFPYLNDCALIRELHVYGNMNSVSSVASDNNTQHRGFGKMMMKEAETIAYHNGYNKIAVISGVGVRAYYMKLGYSLVDTYMIKTLSHNTFVSNYTIYRNCIIITIIIIIILINHYIYKLF